MPSKWNIIFIAIDTNPNGNSKQVKEGIDNFEADVLSRKDLLDKDRISIDMLIYQNNSVAGDAFHKKMDFEKKDFVVETIKDFKVFCQKNQNNTVNGYEDFFKKVITANTVQGIEQKYIVILLAHSFGLGFAAFKPEESCNELFLDSKDLYLAIKNAGFPGNKIDCFVGVNCLIQNTTFNYLFSDISEYIIGSQLAINANLIRYKKLVDQLNEPPELSVNLFFTKILYDFVDCKNDDDTIDDDRVGFFSTSSLSLTRPKLAEDFYNRFNKLVSLVEITSSMNVEELENDPDLRAFREISITLVDASSNSNKDFFDAFTFFNELYEIYRGQNLQKKKIVEEILEILRRLVMKEIGGLDSFTFDNTLKLIFYFPFGINVFIPNGDGAAKQIILEMVTDIHKFKNPSTAETINIFLRAKDQVFVAANNMK